jgi:hypothetical protein
VRRHEPVLQEALVDDLRRVVDTFAGAPPMLPPLDPGYLVPMLVHAARQHGNDIVDAVPRYSSADHTVNWYCLVSALTQVIDFTDPYFHFGASIDPAAKAILQEHHDRYRVRHQLASFEVGHWELFTNDAGYAEIGLTPPARRSALNVVASRAERYILPAEVGDILDAPISRKNLKQLVTASANATLAVLRESRPDSWRAMSAGLGFDLDEQPLFLSYLLDLLSMPPAWYSQDELLEMWKAYRDRELDQSAEAFAALLACHSVSPTEGVKWNAVAPLLRCGDHFIPWFFGFHGMHPDLVFLTLLIRRHERLWSQTVGATLAHAADWLGRRLNGHGRIEWRARRSAPDGTGDADLVLLDTVTGDVAVFELKTTFDKFRTSFQLRNFTDQRVNYSKAFTQANQAADALRSGAWPLRSVFGPQAPDRANEVFSCVLTWWDTYNPTSGSAGFTPSCNYATLAFVLDEAQGDLAQTMTALSQLGAIYCPARLATISEASDTTELVYLELQTDAVPPPSTWPAATQLTLALLSAHEWWPEDWAERDEMDPSQWHIY